MGLIDATLEGAKLRFRPNHDDLPCVWFWCFTSGLEHGAGAGAMNAIGTGVLGGNGDSHSFGSSFCTPLLCADRKDLWPAQEG